VENGFQNRQATKYNYAKRGGWIFREHTVILKKENHQAGGGSRDLLWSEKSAGAKEKKDIKQLDVATLNGAQGGCEATNGIVREATSKGTLCNVQAV